ncbi:TPA: VOC family protein [Staphylococcus aureus]|nr:VOC family protein [Staphylococcus aureus]HDE6982050.1 VOC family protein [Staphylococcus aureus]
MCGLRSITLGTTNIEQTKHFMVDILGLNYEELLENSIRFGDADISPGTRLQFIQVPSEQLEESHFVGIGLRTPTDSGLEEYAEILSNKDIPFTTVKELNGNKYFSLEDNNGHIFSIYSNENNYGVGLGMPSFESAVNPLHQVQGLGPVILKVNHVDITDQILTNIFGLEVFAEYQPFDNADYHVQVFKVGTGGLGGEIHLMPVETEMTMPEYGAVDQVEFETKDADFFNQAKSRLDEVEIPYQTLEQDDIESIRITENSGLSFIFTLQKYFFYDSEDKIYVT